MAIEEEEEEEEEGDAMLVLFEDCSAMAPG